MNELYRRQSWLVGREPEQRLLSEFLDTVSDRSAQLVVVGEAGEGKSALLAWGATEAEQRGHMVLRSVGMEFECELPYSGLEAALRPVLGDVLDQLPSAQRSALAVALGTEVGDAPALAVYAATLSALTALAVDTPVVAVVDDAQWLDRASLEALLFSAHRTSVDHVGFLFAQRADSPCLLDHTGFERHEMGGIPRAAAVALMAEDGVAVDVAERCWRLTGGNPLALIEGARRLSDRQRSGEDPLPPALPVAAHLLDAFWARLQRLPDESVRALGLAALAADDDLTLIGAALARAGGDLSDLEPAEQHDLVVLADGRLTWCHPLLRSAVHQRISDRWRRRAHRALADASQATGNDDQALWHLSETITGPDDDLAGRLAQLGDAARRRGAPDAATAAHLRASSLATDAAAAARHLVAAADARMFAGDVLGVTELLTDRIGSVSDVEVRGEMAALLGQGELWALGTTAALERFELHAGAVSECSPAVAALLLLHASTARLLALEPALAVEAAARAATVAEGAPGTAVSIGATAMGSLSRVFLGSEKGDDIDTLELLSHLLLGALGSGSLGTEGVDDLAQLCGFCLLATERWAEAQEMLGIVARSGETTGMVGRTAFARLLLSEALWRAGRWGESLAQLTDSLALQEAIRRGQVMPGSLALLARFEAGFGRRESCREHVEEVLGGPPRIAMFDAIAHSAVGLLELGAGRYAESATAFDEVEARVCRVGEPGWLWWQGDAIEAYARAGRGPDAHRLLTRVRSQATATGRRWAFAAAERSAALLGLDDADDRATVALDEFRNLGAPFEEARTLLIRGQARTHQGRHEAGARDIAAARTIFGRLGARAWTEQASALRGESAGGDDSLAGRLTPAELRVALAVGHGASNREAAEQLYISVKTVDYHLQGIYRKLGLRSRTQLMAIVLSDA